MWVGEGASQGHMLFGDQPEEPEEGKGVGTGTVGSALQVLHQALSFLLGAASHHHRSF